MTSKIVVNNIQADAGVSTVTFGSNIQGNLIGNVTGNINSTGVTTVTTLNVGTGASISSSASNVLTLGTNNAERVRISSSGNTGIGTNNPSAILDVESNDASAYIAEFRQKNANNSAQLIIDSPTNGTSRPVLIDLARAGTVQWSIGQGYLASSDRLIFATSSLKDGTAGEQIAISTTGNLLLKNGAGIDFSATSNSSGTMTSELLADYEEGTFTPIDDSGAGLTFGANTKGHYVRMGNVVHAFIRVVYPSTGSGSLAQVAGLPFAGFNPSGADVSNGSVPSGFGYISGGSVIPQIHMNGGAARTNFYNLGTAMTNANFSGLELRFGITYRTS